MADPSPPVPFPASVAQSVGHRLVRLVSLLRREADARMAAHGLTDAQWKPLWLLHIGRATTPAELARELDTDAGAVTRLLDRLEAKGLVARTRSATDRRVVQLALSQAGHSAVAQVPAVLATVNQDLQRGFSEAERQMLTQLLDRLLANAAELPTVAPPAAFPPKT
ncbi:MAG: MarR family transcriptional regulator [Burkholderiaceae bacterium]|nr:MarR family transcriptional regulator [Burkholderiaceae bacterium]